MRFVLAFCVFISAACFAGDATALDALVNSSGGLKLSAGSRKVFELTPGAFEPGWKQAQAIGSYKDAGPNADSRPFKVKLGGNNELAGSVEAKQDGDAASFSYSFTPVNDTSLLSTHLNGDFSHAQLEGTSWKADDKEGVFDPKSNVTHIFNGSIKTLKLKTTDGTELRFEFAQPTPVLLQDNKQWTPSFSVRMGPQFGSPAPFKKGETRKVEFKLSASAPLKVAVDNPVTIVAGPEWIPLKLELDIEAGSALDFSNFGFHDAPAGKHGRVIARPDGQFAFEKNPETARKFYGVNFCFGAHFLAKDEADRIADRLVRLGYNAMRFHHHEHELTSKQANSTLLNPEKLDQFDYLMAALIKRGVYLTTDLFVSRPVTWKDIGIERAGNVEMDTYKILVPIVPAAYENWKTFARNFLTHKNPYTGRTYAEEPALAWLSLINEGTYGNFVDRAKNVPEWNTAWQAWMQKKYANREALAAAWKNELKTDEDPTKSNIAFPPSMWNNSPRVSDCTEFFAEIERQTYEKMRTFLREELNCKALLTNMNAWTYHTADQHARAAFDYVDDHFYVDHPEFIERPWSLPSKCPNTSPVADGGTGGRTRSFTRLYGKPFTITEYNFSGPGRFRGVGGILTGAMGALQDWSAIWRFAYSHDRNAMLTPQRLDYFNMATDPLGQASERATLCLFLRGDMRPAEKTIGIVMTEAEAKALRPQPNLAPSWDYAAWIQRVGTQIVKEGDTVKLDAAIPVGADSKAISKTTANVTAYSKDDVPVYLRRAGFSDFPPARTNNLESASKEIHINGPADTLVLNTPRTAGGYAPANASFNAAASGVAVKILEADATVFVNALDDKPIKDSKRLLVTHLTDLQNTEIKYAERARQTLLSWGKIPHLVRAGKAEIQIAHANAAKLKVYALATGGKRIGEVKSAIVDGKLTFTADVSESAAETGARMLYEITE